MQKRFGIYCILTLLAVPVTGCSPAVKVIKRERPVQIEEKAADALGAEARNWPIKISHTRTYFDKGKHVDIVLSGAPEDEETPCYQQIALDTNFGRAITGPLGCGKDSYSVTITFSMDTGDIAHSLGDTEAKELVIYKAKGQTMEGEILDIRDDFVSGEADRLPVRLGKK